MQQTLVFSSVAEVFLGFFLKENYTKVLDIKGLVSLQKIQVTISSQRNIRDTILVHVNCTDSRSFTVSKITHYYNGIQ